MTQTIYGIFQNQSSQPGLVEIINLYDNRYFAMAIDGEIIATTSKESYESTVLKRSFIKKCVSKSGVKESKLLFVYIDWEEFGDANMTDYDANDFDDYSQFIDFFNNNPGISFVWKGQYYDFVKVLATGIDELEEKV